MVRFADRLRCFATGDHVIELIADSTSLAPFTAATAIFPVVRTELADARMASTLCERSHGNLIAGSCPWCGSLIIDGQAYRTEFDLLRRELSKHFPEWFQGGDGSQLDESSGDSEATDHLLNLIESVGTDAGRAIPLLLVALKDSNSAIREAAANALGKIGPEAKAALPTLYLLLNDEDILVRNAADAAIDNIGI